MRKILFPLLAAAAIGSVAQASACPEANYDACSSHGYSIVETEEITYWPHNEMASAHQLDSQRKTVTRRPVRRRARRHTRRCR
jgi:hypothetical protein